MADGVMILGSSGFVGSALVRSLEKQNRELFCISTQPANVVRSKKTHCYTTTLDDEENLREILPKCRYIFYLASHSNPGFSAYKPFLEVKYNLLPGLRFLETLQDYSDIYLIYLSSGGAIYGFSQDKAITEKNPLTPISYYGAGKASMEKFILAYCIQSQGSAAIIRPTNFYGPGQPYKKGFGIIPTIFHHISTNESLPIWGDGEAVRDFLFIDDFIELCLLLLHSSRYRPGFGRIYNVGAEVGTSINRLCDIIEEVTGREIIRNYQKARVVDVPRSELSCSKVKNDLQWSAKTDLHDGIEKTWAWYQKQIKK